MLQAVLEAEVGAFLDEHHQRSNANGCRSIVRIAYLPPREEGDAAGLLEIRQPRMRDRWESSLERVEFIPKFTADGHKELIALAD